MARNEATLSRIRDAYEKARRQKDQLGLLAQWRLAERFWQARQWPASTPPTFPQPVLNMVWEFVERKVAIIASEEPRIVFTPRTPGVSAEKVGVLNVAADWQWDQAAMSELYDSVLRTAALMGTAVVQVAFNPDLSGGSKKAGTLWNGGVEMVEVDPENFFPGDGSIPQIQRQPYILVADEVPIAELRELYRDSARRVGTSVDDLEPSPPQDAALRIYPQQNLDRPEVGLRIRLWWRESGRLNHAVAAQGLLLRYTEGIYEHGYYPFTALRWYPRRKSFWGLSEFEQLLPNQRAVNRLLGFLINSAQMTGLPQRFAKAGALPPGVQWIPGDSSLLLIDNSPGTGPGLGYLQPPSPSPAVMQTLEYLVQRTRQGMGVLDAISGQAPSAQLNATAIAYLQQAAAVLMRPVIARAHAWLEDVGRLWFAFWTEPDLFKAARTVQRKGGEPVEFRGEEFADEEYDVEIALHGGNFFDMSAQTQLALDLHKAGVITAQEALLAIPSRIFPAKDAILETRRAQPAPAPAPAPQAAGLPVPSDILAALGGGQAPTPEGGVVGG
ncbi:MAG: hypothetical protein QJR08_03740 [Bacillota bacterium]|nr:hypothetical protein [Bacillota bacterium]